jgi:uncharacterized alpha-E superfamily protein
VLSRTAESVFLIGRDIERADGSARILDVHLQLLLDDPWIEEDLVCRSLLAVMGSTVLTGTAQPGTVLTRSDVLTMLAVDRHDAASIAHALGAARENARRAREIVSTELWDCLNTTRARMPRKVAGDKVHEFFGWVRERSALAVGIIESATSRDEVWSLFTLGRSIERADMTARLLAERALTEASGASWTTLLRSCGAYEPYLRTSHGDASARNAAEFLLRDHLFPRSVLFSIARAEHCLQDIGSAATGGEADPAQLLAQVRSDLESRPIETILEDLTPCMQRVQRTTAEASDAIRARYFPVDPAS